VSGGGRQPRCWSPTPTRPRSRSTSRVTTAKGTFRPPASSASRSPTAAPPSWPSRPWTSRARSPCSVRSVNGAAFVAALRVTEGDGNRPPRASTSAPARPSGTGWSRPPRAASSSWPTSPRRARGPPGRPHRPGERRRRAGAGPARPGRRQEGPDGIDNLVVQAGRPGWWRPPATAARSSPARPSAASRPAGRSPRARRRPLNGRGRYQPSSSRRSSSMPK
jgi:hypothetical protein